MTPSFQDVCSETIQNHMNIRTNIIALLLLIFSSCGNNKNQTDPSLGQKKALVNNLANTKDSLKVGYYVSQKLLRNNLAMKSTYSSELNNIGYNKIFNSEGLRNIVVYYDKTTEVLHQLSNFEDFLLFEANYVNADSAKKAFEQVKSYAKLTYSNEQNALDGKLSDRLKLLKLGSSFGGLITYNGKQVFSLIENCEKLPFNKSWLEFEYMFTDLLKNKRGSVEVLKAGCNEGIYYSGRRKASS